MVEEVLEDFGYEKERFMISWCSAAEPDRFAEEVTKMTKKVEALGPHRNSLAKAKVG